MECFDNRLLAFNNGKFLFPLNNGTIIDGPVYDRKYQVVEMQKQHAFQVKLPDHLECKHCLLQVKRLMNYLSFLL